MMIASKYLFAAPQKFTSIVLVLLAVLVIGDLQGQEKPDFENYQYRYVGPTRGGRVTAVAGIASKPSTFYMGATGGGVWRTKDYGNSWNNISDGFFETPSIGAIRVAQNDANIIYVGTGTDGLRSNIISGKGMYKSVDEGSTWKHIGLKDVGQIGAVEIDPQNNNTVFVAAIGQAFNANKERGIYRTKDGGLSWKQVLHVSDTTGFSDLELMPTNSNIIYAAAWRAERKPWTIISGGKENGIWKSVDGGETWNRRSEGLPKLMGKIDLAVCPADSKVVYALVEAPDGGGGLYRSIDQGESYTQVSDKFELLDRPFYYCNVDVDPKNPDIVYVNSTRFWKSENAGESWTMVSTPHGDNHDMWINPDNSDLIVQGNDGGANVSTNGCKTWSHQMNQPTAEIYQVEVDNQHPYWLYGGLQDNYSTVAVPSLPPHTHQVGATGFMMNTGGCETGPAVPHPTNPDIVYSNCKGRFSVFNKASGQEQSYDVGARYMYGHNPKDLKYRFQRVSPIHISPHDAGVIYHTSQYVHRTMDEGKTWETISPDLTAFEADKQVRSGFPISNDITGEEFYSTIYAIRESTLEKGVIYVGANDGPIHVTQNDGKDWKNITPSGLAKGGRVDCVEPSPHKEGKAYVSILRYQLGDWKPYIYKTMNHGASWTLITEGIPADHPVRVVREDPGTEGILYAGTEYGMYISLNDGKSWSAFQQNLPTTPITDLKLHRDDLVLSTMGRGFWIIDNIKSISSQVNNPTANTILPINNSYRYRYSTYRGMGGFPGAPNYPRPGVNMDYYLADSTITDLKLDILNSININIRSYSNKDIVVDPKSERDMATNEIKYTISKQLKSEQGYHRFSWDMRHFGAWDKSKSRKYQNGPYAAPGKYKARLIVNGDTLVQAFELATDPRVLRSGVSEDDIHKQETLALDVRELLSSAKKLSDQISKKSKSLKSKDSETFKRLTILEDRLVRSKGRYTQVKFVNQINYLSGILNGADQKPGMDAYTRFEELKDEMDGMQEEYAQINKLLESKKDLKVIKKVPDQ